MNNIIEIVKPNIKKGMYYITENGTVMKSMRNGDVEVEPVFDYSRFRASKRVYRLRTNAKNHRYTVVNLDKLLFLNSNQFERMIKNGFKYMEYSKNEYLYRITDRLDVQIYSISKCKFIISNYDSVTKRIINHVKELEEITW